eukprot:7385400-Prymnesium_polylepis.1
MSQLLALDGDDRTTATDGHALALEAYEHSRATRHPSLGGHAHLRVDGEHSSGRAWRAHA